MAQEERKKVELWIEATKRLVAPEEPNSAQSGNSNLSTSYYTLIMAILQQNTTIPIIIIEADTVNSFYNIHFREGRKKQVLKKELEKEE